MDSCFELTYSQVDEVHTIAPETAAHNIAFAYVSSPVGAGKLHASDETVMTDVLSLSKQYIDAYNYAYNFIVHENKVIEAAE